jgi:hypothetical protein
VSRLPKYTRGVMTEGRTYFYLRVPGRKQVRLPGLPWTPEFMEARERALKDEWIAPALGAGRTKAGTVNAALVSYYQSSAFTDGLSLSSQRMRRAILERFREAHGDKRIALLHKKAMQAILNKKSPAAASNWRKALRGFIDHCLTRDMIAPSIRLLASSWYRSSLTVITLGSRKSVRSSKPITRSAPGRGWPMSCCCRLDSHAAMS